MASYVEHPYCNLCGYSTVNNNKLSWHRFAHTLNLNEPADIACPICNSYCTRSLKILKIHFFAHFDNAAYQCPYCQFVTYYKFGLSCHYKRVHTKDNLKGNKEVHSKDISNGNKGVHSKDSSIENKGVYSTDSSIENNGVHSKDSSLVICEKRILIPIKKQIRNKENEASTQNSPDDIKNINKDNNLSLVQSALKPEVFDGHFTCPECKISFTAYFLYLRHLRFHNKKTTPFCCHVCKSYLASKQNLKSHIICRHSVMTSK